MHSSLLAPREVQWGGSQFARLEARLAFTALLEQTSDISQDATFDELSHHDNINLPVRQGAAAAARLQVLRNAGPLVRRELYRGGRHTLRIIAPAARGIRKGTTSRADRI